MYCEKYSATIPVNTCIARQEAARRQRPFWIGLGDPGCRSCSQGCQVMRDFRLRRARAMVAAAGRPCRRGPEDAGCEVYSRRAVDLGSGPFGGAPLHPR